MNRRYMATVLLVLGLLAESGAVRAGDIQTDGKLISTAGTGPPLQVSSGQRVANLNADLVDGLHASQLATAATTYTKSEVDSLLSDLQAQVSALAASLPFAVTTFANDPGAITTTPTAVVSVQVTAPVDGHVTLNSTAKLYHSGSDDSDVVCVLAESTSIPASNIGNSAESAQWMEIAGSSDEASVSATRTFSISAGSTVTYVLACEELVSDGGYIDGANLTAIFTPA